MKFVEKCYRLKDPLLRNFVLLKGFLLLLSTLSIIIWFFPFDHSVKNQDFSIREIIYEEINVVTSIEDRFIKNGDILEFNTNPDRVNRQTILLLGKPKDLTLFGKIASEMVSTGIKRYNFRFILSDEPVNLDISSFFCAFHIENGVDQSILNPLFAQIMPNSDFFFSSLKFFHIKTTLRFSDFIFHSKQDKSHNFIHLIANENALFQIRRLLRCISNADAFTFGTSFYFSTPTKFYEFFHFLPFFILISLFYASDLLLFDYQLRLPFPFLYLISPIFAIPFVFDSNIQMPFNILFFMAINFKCALIFTFCVYLRAISEFISLLNGKKNKLD